MEGRANREGGFPGDRFVFEVTPDRDTADHEIQWSGGGEPAAGAGRRFVTTFGGGAHTVVASLGADTRQFTVEVCPLETWLAGARTFFGPSLDFSRVKVKGSWAVFGPPGTGWTCNSMVRFKRARRPKDLPVEATLIHELAHVWQHQGGQAQLLKGMVEQLGRLSGRDPYDYGGPDGLRKATKLTEFKKEGQAQIVMDHWKALNGYQSGSKGVPFSTPGYKEDLRRLVEGAGIGRSPTIRRTIANTLDAPVAGLVNAILRIVE
jgi:hypothetical protein